MATYRAFKGALLGLGCPRSTVHAVLMLCHDMLNLMTHVFPPWKRRLGVVCALLGATKQIKAQLLYDEGLPGPPEGPAPPNEKAVTNERGPLPPLLAAAAPTPICESTCCGLTCTPRNPKSVTLLPVSTRRA